MVGRGTAGWIVLLLYVSGFRPSGSQITVPSVTLPPLLCTYTSLIGHMFLDIVYFSFT